MFFHIVDRTEVRTAFLAIEEEKQDAVEKATWLVAQSVAPSSLKLKPIQ
jgi:hypothetical protein